MSDQIKHECGIALIRLLKPLEYYQLKYGSWLYGLEKLYLLMEKQHNRGQDGAGVVGVKLDLPPGNKYIFRHRSIEASPIDDVFRKIYAHFKKKEIKSPDLLRDAKWAKENVPFASEIYLGHLRYGTYGRNNIENVHPVMRQNNWKSRNLVMAGNFNLTNVSDLFKVLIDLGQNPKDFSDTVTVLENVGHFLDGENQRLFRIYKDAGYSNVEISELIQENLDIKNILHESSKRWDGGYVISGIVGHGDAFVIRDPWGIRPAYYYHNDEVAVVTSERPVIQTVFNVPAEDVHEITPGYAVIIRKNGEVTHEKVLESQERRSCSFERIYFSRGSDVDIYQERKKLGELLTPAILKAVDYDLEHTVFSFIPNTAETAFYGMLKGVENFMINEKKRKIVEIGRRISEEDLTKILDARPRIEKIAIKDIKLRTFISQDKGRKDLVGHVYDITYGTIKKGVDNLVIIDDSIVRGTTLKQSIIKILDRLGPKKIVVLSSSPQIRYPDCYGIDMSKFDDFIAFKAAITLLRETGRESVINDVYNKSKAQQHLPKEQIVNYVKEIYAPFTDDEVSEKITKLLTDKDVEAEVEVVYQSIDNLHKACPNDLGDWYFTGNYPTPGGNRVVNNAFIDFIEGKHRRAY
ncbi:MAG: amidophosphoribosyltransferase [Bacteroidota bacterium]|nr:amidophosphoribosyltransferase [Bacteroidota bacterium]MDP4225137.1 amidophosphoribosyltransferase [Bacteroidota bacterium]MDP4273614.1 amidophosphoribosyltransferase [Bacteroidota bacterium]